MIIRHATNADIKAIDAIARQWPAELAFVRTHRSIEQRELFVAEQDGVIVGFVRWHARRDGWQTVLDMGVDQAHHGQGIGRALLYAVPCPIQLKCTEDNALGDRFYLGAGMRLVRQDQGKKRRLNVYQMNVLNIIVRGNSTIAPGIARQSGSAYGFAEQDTAYGWPFMLDVNWTEPNWSRYLSKVNEHRPVQAMVTDYEAHIPQSQMLAQVADLRAAGVLRILVCPKFPGAVAHIPKDCIVAVSLRTDGKLTKGANKYAGWMPDLHDLTGRKVHLLGGSPQLQKQIIVKLAGVGATVISVDGNAQFGAAARGSVYRDNVWNRRNGEKVPMREAALMSSRNIQREINALGQFKQLALFR